MKISDNIKAIVIGVLSLFVFLHFNIEVLFGFDYFYGSFEFLNHYIFLIMAAVIGLLLYPILNINLKGKLTIGYNIISILLCVPFIVSMIYPINSTRIYLFIGSCIFYVIYFLVMLFFKSFQIRK